MGCNFRVGMKVVCVNADGVAEILFVKGSVYTVSYIGVTQMGNYVINLEEVPVTSPEGSWYASRFRPIVERKTSIEVFRSLLNPSKVGEPV